MATFRYLIDEVISRLTGTYQTDEARAPSPSQVLQNLEWAYNQLLYNQSIAQRREFGSSYAGMITQYDPLLYKDEVFKIVDNKVTLPTRQNTLPYSTGPVRIYFEGCNGCVEEVAVVFQQQLQFKCKTPFSDRAGSAAATGNVIHFQNMGLVDEVHVVYINTNFALNAGTDFDIDAEAPIKADLIFATVDMATKALMGMVQLPQDVENAGIDD